MMERERYRSIFVGVDIHSCVTLQFTLQLLQLIRHRQVQSTAMIQWSKEFPQNYLFICSELSIHHCLFITQNKVKEGQQSIFFKRQMLTLMKRRRKISLMMMGKVWKFSYTFECATQSSDVENTRQSSELFSDYNFFKVCSK